MNMAKIVGKATSKLVLLGPISFYVGLLIALVAALITTAAPSPWLYVGLAVIGIVVGLLNVTAKETAPFLLAAIALIITVTGMQSLIQATGVVVPLQLSVLAASVTVLVGAGAAIIALLAIYEISKSR
jgi:hypothetical protein